jgi:hypothetical protein
VKSVDCPECGIRLYAFQSKKRRMHFSCYLRRAREAGIPGSVPLLGFFGTVAACYALGAVLSVCFRSWAPLAAGGVVGLFAGLLVAVVGAVWRAIADWKADRRIWGSGA